MASAQEGFGGLPLSTRQAVSPAETSDWDLLALSRHLSIAEDIAVEDDEFHARLASTIADIVQAGEVAFWALQSDGSLRLRPRPYGFSEQPRMPSMSEEQLGAMLGASAVIPLRYGTRDHPDDIGELLAVGVRTADRSLGLLTVAHSIRSDGFSNDDIERLRIASLGAAFLLEHRRLAALRPPAPREDEPMPAAAIRRSVRLDLLHLMAAEMRESLSAAQAEVATAAHRNAAPDRIAERLAETLSVLPVQLEQISRVIGEMRPAAAISPGGRLQLDREPVRLGALTAEVARAVDLLAGEQSPFVVEVRADSLVDADRRALTSILVTMLLGALRAASRDNPIRVTCDESEDVGTVTVSQAVVGRRPGRHAPVSADPMVRIAMSGASTAQIHLLARLHGGQIITTAGEHELTTSLTVPVLLADTETDLEPGEHGEGPTLQVFHDRQVVERDGRRLRLTWTEWQLFAFLWGHPGLTFSRNELANAIWGTELVDRSAEVEMYISRVRRKVERDARHPQIILTERHMGYRLERPRGNRSTES